MNITGIYEQKLESLNKIISKNKLGFMYEFQQEQDNGLILPFFSSYMDSLNRIGLDFSVTTDKEATAGIIYNEKLIFISFGLIDRVSKLSELILSSGILDGKEKPIRYYDLHLIDNPFTGFKIDDNVFESDDQINLYLFIFDQLLSFIITHEVGHFVNGHGNRLKKSNVNYILDDIEKYREIIGEEVIASHARELVADNYAFHLISKFIDSSLGEKPIDLLLNKFKGENGSILLTLVLVTCYFQLMDSVSTSKHFNQTHPEAIARAFYIMATYDESHMKDPSFYQFDTIYPKVMVLVERVFKQLDTNFKTTWKDKIITEEMEIWYEIMNKEFQLWVR